MSVYGLEGVLDYDGGGGGDVVVEGDGGGDE